jgi:hypothetical protein
MLHFIQRYRCIQAGNEAVWIAFGRSQNARVVKSEVLAVLFRQFRRLHQGALPGLTSAVYQDSRRVCQSIQKPGDKVAMNHSVIIIHNVEDNQP